MSDIYLFVPDPPLDLQLEHGRILIYLRGFVPLLEKLLSQPEKLQALKDDLQTVVDIYATELKHPGCKVISVVR